MRLSLGDVATTSDLEDHFEKITAAIERMTARLDELEARVHKDLPE